MRCIPRLFKCYLGALAICISNSMSPVFVLAMLDHMLAYATEAYDSKAVMLDFIVIIFEIN